MIALVSRAWLGPGYQVTSQVNVVRPGGQAQDPHRDYHLGFLENDVVEQYPTHVHLLSPVLTLQGAVAHSDMPVESGPTMYLPYSHQYAPGYLAWRLPEFRAYFAEHYVQLPLAKGDAVFFNPALFHGAGTNVSSDIQRVANLLQVSSAFGRAMETVDRDRVLRAVYPVLLDRKAAGVPADDAGHGPSPPPPRATPSRPTSTSTSRSAGSPRPRRPSWRRTPSRRTPRPRTSRASSTTTPHAARRRDRRACSTTRSCWSAAGRQGVGGAVARAAVDEGATVAVSGRREDVGRGRSRRSSPSAAAARPLFVAADVADVAQARGSVEAVVRRFGRIDCLVNAAGLTSRGSLLDTTPELFDAHVAVNLRGAVLPHAGGRARTWSRAAHRARSSTSSRCRPTAASRSSRRTSPPRPVSPA